jgi:hypothetical protein
VGAAVLGGWLAGSGSAYAGVYFSMEGEPLPPPNWVEREVGHLRSLPSPLPEGPNVEIDPRRPLFDSRFAALEAKARDGNLATIDRIDLGACYIRKVRYADAVRVLKAGDQEDFLILLNLATAYHNQGQLTEAVACQEKALRNWPALYPGWSTGSRIWYRRAENLYLKLLRLREQEKHLEETGRGTGTKNQTVDALFPRTRFVGPGGRYEPGPFPRLWEELAPDASQLVLQLVLWMPWDDRLYWLYGEVLNAAGQVDWAYKVFDEIVWKRKRTDFLELVEHRKVLAQALQESKPWTDEMKLLLLTAVRPRGGLEPPVVGALAPEMGPASTGWYLERKKNQNLPVPQTAGGEPEKEAVNWLPNWQTATVSFVAGVLVAVLVGLQWREWRRSRAPGLPRLDPAATAPFTAGDPAASGTAVVPESTHVAGNP